MMKKREFIKKTGLLSVSVLGSPSLISVLSGSPGSKTSAANAPAVPKQLTVCGETHPQDVSDIAPVLRWTVPSGVQQKAFHVLIGTNANLVATVQSRMFDSGWVDSSDPAYEHVVADNKSSHRLGRLREPYYWTVRVRDSQGRESDWAPVESLALRPPMPPRWALGLVLSAWAEYSTTDKMRYHCEQARQHGIPADAACIDLVWGDHMKLVDGWGPGWKNQPVLESWLQQNGFKFIIINHLSFEQDTKNPVMVEMFNRGYINKNSAFKPIINLKRPGASLFQSDGLSYAPDFANPAARQFIKDKILKPYIDAGVDAWWNDFFGKRGNWGASVTTDSDLYLKMMWESLAENTHGGNGRPFMISQPACRLYPAFSPGVPVGHWRAILTQVVAQIRASQNNMSGMIHAVNNMYSPMGTEYLARSSAFGLLFPMVWNHDANFPWRWQEDLIPIYAKYSRLHYRLIPYYYTAFHQEWQDGVPVLHSMDAAFPGASYPSEMTADLCPFNLPLLAPLTLDPEFLKALNADRNTIRVIDTQFLLGKDLLIVPVYPNPLPDENPNKNTQAIERTKPLAGITTKRKFWLPPGKWADFWSATVNEGPMVMEVDCPIDMLPIFVSMGAIIPMQPEMDYVDQKPVDPLTLDIYPQDESRYDLYEDDGVTRDYRKGVHARTEITCSATPSGVAVIINPPRGPYAPKVGNRSYVLRVLSSTPSAVRLGDHPHPWTYDAAAGKVIIAVPPNRDATRVVIAH